MQGSIFCSILSFYSCFFLLFFLPFLSCPWYADNMAIWSSSTVVTAAAEGTQVAVDDEALISYSHFLFLIRETGKVFVPLVEFHNANF